MEITEQESLSSGPGISEDSNAPPKYGYIQCCECGLAIQPNAANMCLACIQGKVDITQGIPRQGTICFCKSCERFLQPPNTWIAAALESRELLAICLKRLKGLNKVRLVDAGFIWTEPHSKRLKVKLTIEKEVLNGAILQQSFVIELVVSSLMCTECQRVEAKDYWRALVQVRQDVHHKKTLFYLEQLLLKHDMHRDASAIKTVKGGIDFFYPRLQEARKMVDFLNSLLPTRYQYAQELVTHDAHNNTYDYKHTFAVQIVPVCKE